MPRVVTSTELQKKTREVIDWTRVKGEPVVVESYGKPMAAVLSYEEYQRYLQYRQARAERFARLRKVAAENASAGRLTEEEASSLVDEVRQEIYEESDRGE